MNDTDNQERLSNLYQVLLEAYRADLIYESNKSSNDEVFINKAKIRKIEREIKSLVQDEDVFA